MVELRKATHEAIKYACINFHYSKCVPSVQYGYNVYNDKKEWCGVICFGCGAAPNLANSVGLMRGEVLELVRVALNGKQSCTSECVACALRVLHKDAPQIKIIVSFADLDQGHAGTIYQATNWIYIGNNGSNERGGFVIHGKKIHPRTIGSRGWVQSLEWLKEHIDTNAKEFISKGKHKYLFVYDKKLRKQWLDKQVPYPKKTT